MASPVFNDKDLHDDEIDAFIHLALADDQIGQFMVRRCAGTAKVCLRSQPTDFGDAAARFGWGAASSMACIFRFIPDWLSLISVPYSAT